MADKSIENKIIVITGGARGIGLEIADNFLKYGAKITILLDLNENEGESAVKTLSNKYGENKAVYYKCDVTTDLDKTFTEIFNTYKNIDILVNNAGIANESTWQKCVDINLTSLIAWSYKFFEHMRKDRGGNGGTMLNVASILGCSVSPFNPVYIATKFGVMGFTRSLGHAANFAKTGVRVIALCPGFTKTQLIPVEDKSVLKIDIPSLAKTFEEFMEKAIWQDVDVVGKAAAEAFVRAETGSAWVIKESKPIEEVVQ